MYGALGCGFVLCLLLVIPNGVFAAAADASCASPVALLEGRRKVDGATLRASNSMIFHSPSEALLDGNGWCSGQLGGDIFDPYLEVNFGTSVLFTAIVTKGFGGTPIQRGYFLERYQLKLAREDNYFWYIAKPTDSNSSQLEEAIFPLEQNSITNDNQHTEQLPLPLIGQILRIDPYEWSNNDHACTKLEVYGCPLQECQGNHQLGNNANTVVTVNGAQINHDDLFNFDLIAQRYCVSMDESPPTFNISFSSPVLVMEIGIRGLPLPLPLMDKYVKSFSLSYAVDDNITSYTSANGLTTFNVPDSQRQYFGLWPPISTRQLFVIIHDWQLRPCLNLWISGCISTDSVEHSIDPSAPTAGLVDNPVVIETTTETVILPTTVFVTTTVANSPLPTTSSPLPTTSLPLPSTTLRPSSTQGSSTLCSQEDDDNDNTPIYVSIAIVLVGVFVTAIIVIVGVIMCRRRSRSQVQLAKSSDPLIPKSYGSINSAAPTSAAVGVDNDLYGRPELRTSNIEEDSDEEPLPLHDNPPNDPIYDKPPHRQIRDETAYNPIYDELPHDGNNNPTYGVLLSGEQSDNYSEPTQ